MRILMPDFTFGADDLACERGVFGPGVEFDPRAGHEARDVPDEAWAACDAVLLWRMFIDAGTIAKLARCKIIVRYGVGFDRVDLEAARAKGIAVCNTPDYGTTEVADHAIALAMALRRGLTVWHDGLRDDLEGYWDFAKAPLIRRSGVQTFGVLGAGRIGTAAALRAKGLGFKVVMFDPYQPRGYELGIGVERIDQLEAFLERTDVLSLHAPLTAETRNLIGRDAFARLPEQAVLVNTARGAIIDLDALYQALESGRLGGAGLDVTPVEPPPADHPLIKAYRARAPWLHGRFILTPHAAFFSPQAWNDVRVKAAETAQLFLFKSHLRNAIVDPREPKR